QMITVITCTNRNAMMENIFYNYSIQTMKNKELIIILNNDDMDLNVWKNKAKKYPSVFIYQMPARMMVSDCKNYAIQKAKYTISQNLMMMITMLLPIYNPPG